MEMHQIRYFFVVAEELNFTRATERCNVAQPSISRAIKMLETELGGPLFHRERGNTHLSELGRIMKPYLELVYQDAEAAKQQAANFTRLKKTPLRLGLMCTIAPDYLLDFITSVLTRQPGIVLQIADASAEQLEAALVSGEREVAIYARPSKPKDDRLYYMPLYEEEFVLAAPENHPLCANATVPIAALNGERYLSRINERRWRGHRRGRSAGCPILAFSRPLILSYSPRGGDGPGLLPLSLGRGLGRGLWHSLT
jgi:DNA-binding transcriptional LysR family regulator